MKKEHNDILKGVSRSFYLSLRFLPRTLRDPLSYAFLLCKIADTIADTDLIPPEKRLESLQTYRSVFLEPMDRFRGRRLGFGAVEGTGQRLDKRFEMELLAHIDDILESVSILPPNDLRHILWLLLELTQGMITDLTTPILSDEAALDHYTYNVAGCVGRFWTRMLKEHCPFASAWNEHVEEVGETFGKGLQMVNILRDLPHDHVRGRSYLPDEKNPRSYFGQTRKLLSAGKEYAHFIPRRYISLRSAVLLPMKLGFKTLDAIEQSPTWPDPNTVVKVSRSTVYWTLLTTMLR